MIRRLLRACGVDVIRYPLSPHGRLPRAKRRELARLARDETRSISETGIFGPPFSIISGPAFSFLYAEISQRGIYKFSADSDTPYIIDCGANVGVALVYFKRLYPKARIVCFEPDPTVFRELENNAKTFGYNDVELVNTGVWDEDTTISFKTDSDSTAGRVVRSGNEIGEETVRVTRLKTYLSEPVDFLKMDIEGAERRVLMDCIDDLRNVKRIFVEHHSFVGQPQELKEVITVLSDSGFRLYLEPTGPLPQQPFETRAIHKGMDSLVNLFGLRES